MNSIIFKAAGKFVLITAQDNTTFNVGDSYPLVSKRGQNIQTIGVAKVVRIQNKKVALQYTLLNPNYDLENDAFIQYE